MWYQVLGRLLMPHLDRPLHDPISRTRRYSQGPPGSEAGKAAFLLLELSSGKLRPSLSLTWERRTASRPPPPPPSLAVLPPSDDDMRSTAPLELHVRRHAAIDASHWPARGTENAPTDASPDKHAAVTMADSMISGQDTAVQSKRLQHDARTTGADQTCPLLKESLYQKAFDVFKYSHSEIF